MKKIYATLLFFALCKIGQSQISLTSSMAPAANTMFLFYDANVPSPAFTFSKSGINNTWDFSAITITPGQVDTIYWVSPSDYPLASAAFPSATHATYESGETGVTMINIDAYFGSYLGAIDAPVSGGTLIPLVATPPAQTMSFPWTYSNALSATTTIDIYLTGAQIGQPTIDSVHLKHSGNFESEVIAAGDIVLPSGTMSSLLERRISINVDSNWFKSAMTGGIWTSAGAPTLSTDSAFYWYTDQSLQPYAHALFDDTGVMHDVTYFMSSVSTGVNNIPSSKSLSVYPNPTRDFLGVKGLDIPGVSEWMVYNVDGQKIMSGKSDLNSLNIQNLSQGTYILRLIHPAGQASELKFVKN